MWVWQSHAPAGTSKFTGVDGCAALEKALLLVMVTPAAMEASIISRRVSIGRLPACSAVMRVKRAPALSVAGGGGGYRRSERAERVRSPRERFHKAYCPDGVRRPCQASRT